MLVLGLVVVVSAVLAQAVEARQQADANIELPEAADYAGQRSAYVKAGGEHLRRCDTD